MTPQLLEYICEPITKDSLELLDAVTNINGHIISGNLVSPSSKRYPIIDGIPRFVNFVPLKTVKSFGDEWNYFNFTDFKKSWLSHTVANTFETTDAFQGKVIVDAGGGSGAQSRWFLEYGAKHVIFMDLSHSVDDVVKRNLNEFMNVDIIQCSIDAPPLRDQSINGIVYCHNVIHHTPSVEKTAHALFALTKPESEFVFNCYDLNDQGLVRWVRWHLIYKPLRLLLSQMPFGINMFYARTMAGLRLVPVLGWLLEKSGFCMQGDVPHVNGEAFWEKIIRRYKITSLNTFDWFGSQSFQHHKSHGEIKILLKELQPDESKILNADVYFLRPPKIGCALRVFR